MTTKAGHVTVKGTIVEVQTDSEASARSIAAQAHSEIIKEGGTAAERVDNGISWLGGIIEVFGRRTLKIVAFFSLLIACYFMAMAGFNFPSNKGSATVLMLGLVMVPIVLKASVIVVAKGGTKDNRAYLYAIPCLLLVSVFFGGSLQSKNVVSADMGRTSLIQEVKLDRASRNALEQELYEMESDLLFTSVSSIRLKESLKRELSKEALNSRGAKTGITVGDLVDHGSDEFCIGTGYYKDKYCDKLWNLTQVINLKSEYERKKDEVEGLIRREKSLLNKIAAQTSPSGMGALGSMVSASSGGSFQSSFATILGGVFSVLLFEMFMIGATYLGYKET